MKISYLAVSLFYSWLIRDEDAKRDVIHALKQSVQFTGLVKVARFHIQGSSD